MNQECIKVLALAIVDAGGRLDADPSAWHEVFYELKQEGLEREIFDQLRFSSPSGGRPYSPEVERLLFQITRAGGSIRENPRLRVIEINESAREQIRRQYKDFGASHLDTIGRVTEAIRDRLRIAEPREKS